MGYSLTCPLVIQMRKLSDKEKMDLKNTLNKMRDKEKRDRKRESKADSRKAGVYKQKPNRGDEEVNIHLREIGRILR